MRRHKRSCPHFSRHLRQSNAHLSVSAAANRHGHIQVLTIGPRLEEGEGSHGFSSRSPDRIRSRRVPALHHPCANSLFEVCRCGRVGRNADRMTSRPDHHSVLLGIPSWIHDVHCLDAVVLSQLSDAVENENENKNKNETATGGSCAVLSDAPRRATTGTINRVLAVLPRAPHRSRLRTDPHNLVHGRNPLATAPPPREPLPGGVHGVSV